MTRPTNEELIEALDWAKEKEWPLGRQVEAKNVRVLVEEVERCHKLLREPTENEMKERRFYDKTE